jgi:hypothetical protein
MDSNGSKPQAGFCVLPHDLAELRRTLAVVENSKAVGGVNPRPPGLHNHFLQAVKKLLARSLDWYSRPLREFHASLARSLTEIYCVLENHSVSLHTLDMKLAQNQLDLLHEQVRALISLENASNAAVAETPAAGPGEEAAIADPPYCMETRLGNDRTTYILGLFGTGRLYINDLILQNIGERAKYFRDGIRVYPGPTSMICSGHVTMKYLSRHQAPPELMRRIAGAVKGRIADSVFIYRHPLDSLLTNWVYWRNYIQENRTICAISDVYGSTDDLCADMERNFFEFKAFAEGDPDFYAGLTGPRFLSFAEFVEESALHYQAATLSLRLEDFMADPAKEFAKIVELMSADTDLSPALLARPRSKPYGHLAVQEKVPRFRNFAGRLNWETRRRIENLGYSLRS